jgi:zinc and cadmium transporter
MHPVALLFVFSVLCVVASLAGGWIPLVVRLTHRRMQIAISFVSGIILGIGVLHLVPHSLSMTGSIDVTVAWLLAGFLFMFFLERFFHFHHHDVADEASESRVDDSDHDHDATCAHDHHHSPIDSPFPWTGAVVGLTLHGMVDGVALAAAVQADVSQGLGGWPGIGAALAVILHKPFDSLTIGTLMAASGHATKVRYLFNALYSLVTPLGILLFHLAYGRFDAPSEVLGQALGFAAGTFICIASSDLLPELQFHRHDRTALSIALVAGIALAWSTIFLEEGGHDHAHGAVDSRATDQAPPEGHEPGHHHDHETDGRGGK